MLASGPTVLLASDSAPDVPVKPGDDVWLTLNCDDPGEVDSVYAALVPQGTANQAPQDAFWGARFAMVTDRFGVRWMLNAQL